MLHDVDEETRMKSILEVLDNNLRIALKINEVVGRLSEKRVTLEEKMIRAYFHNVQANLLDLAALFNRALAQATTPKSNEGPEGGNSNQSAKAPVCSTEDINNAGEAFGQFLARLEPAVDELLKVLRYDLNFVEQYFEFNYYGKLTNEDNYLSDSAQLLNSTQKALAKK